MVKAISDVVRAGKDKGPIITIADKVKIRNLYLGQNLGHTEIAKATGLSIGQVAGAVTRMGLTGVRREREKRMLARSDQALASSIPPILEAISDECEEIALSGLARAKSEVVSTNKNAAKNFQAWTAGVRNLASARSVIRNGNANTLGSGDSDTKSVNLFFMSRPAEKRVSREIDEV